MLLGKKSCLRQLETKLGKGCRLEQQKVSKKEKQMAWRMGMKLARKLGMLMAEMLVWQKVIE